MPVVEREALRSKIKNVAKKSTTKRPQSQFRNHTQELKDRNISTISISTMDSIDTTNVYEETLDNLKSLNGTSVKDNCDNSNTELKILSTESVQDNGLLDTMATEDAAEHVSTDEEDNLLNLSDAESQDITNDRTNVVKNTDSPSHQLDIGVQVRNSVRDIMSKLVQDGSPEVNKILSKPKGDDSSRANSPKTIKPNCENTSDVKTGNKIIKGNLFEIMSAESKSDNMILESSSKSNMNNKVEESEKVVDEKSDNESNLMKKSQDLGMEIESLDRASTEKEESLKETTTLGVSDEQKPNDKPDLKIEDSTLDDGKIQKPEGMDIDDINEDKPESKSNVKIDKESNGSMTSTLESMDIDNTNVLKSEIKTDIESKNIVKVDFSSISDEKLNIDQNNKVKQDDKSDIKTNLDEIETLKDEKTESVSMDNGINSLSKTEPSSTVENMNSKSVSELDKETKKEENIDTKPEIIAERKRSGESPNTDSQAPPKRSRLDIMIGKLGTQIGIAPESVPDPIDCDTVSDSETESKEGSDDAKSDDEESKSMMEDDDVKTIYEEVKKVDSTDGTTVKEQTSIVKAILDGTDKQEDGKEKIKESTSTISETKKTESLKESEVSYSATTISDDEDDDDVKVIEEPIKSSIQSHKNQDISYDSEMDLDQVIRKRVLQLIKSYRDETIAALQTKVNFLTKSTEQWKNTSKELQKQVVDLTIVQQRLDKRKAATAALKSITSRSIGCQVDTTKLQNGGDMVKSPPKGSVKYTSYTTASPNTGQNMVSMIKQQPRPTPTVTTPIVNNMSQLLSATAESRNTNINNVRQGAGVTSVRNLLETTGRANITQTSSSTSTAKNVSYSGKVIDLTADEENTKKLSNSQVKAPIMVPVSNLALGSNQLPGFPAGASILLSGPSGTQIVNHQFNKMGAPLQVVTVSSGTQIRPGQFLTVLPSTAVAGSNIRPQPVTMTTTVPSVTSIGSTPVRQAPPTNTPAQTVKKTPTSNHPAPLPPQPINRTPNGGVKGLVPPKPDLKISRVSQGIVLSWTITQNLSLYSEISSYQLFAYQEGSTPPHSNLWKKVGDVKALPLPMACTLTQFQEGNKYHFAVRAIDVYQRISEFSEPSSIHLFAL